ncbi:sensor histidine kinase [Haliscomenobacter sp.]|uniref:sensor histidine kinase n=1 Tax=Haliscomenobacter sp. TaxID=2717303 RepID=UPI0035931F69
MKLNPVILICCCLFSSGILLAQADLSFVLEWKVGKTYWLDVRQEDKKYYGEPYNRDFIIMQRAKWALQVLKKGKDSVLLSAKINRLRSQRGTLDNFGYFDSKYHHQEEDYQRWNVYTKEFLITVDLQGRVLRHQLLLEGKKKDTKSSIKNRPFFWLLSPPERDENTLTPPYPKKDQYTVTPFLKTPSYTKTTSIPFLQRHHFGSNHYLVVDKRSNWIKYGEFSETSPESSRRVWLRGWSTAQATVKGKLLNFKTAGALKEKEEILNTLRFRFGVKARFDLKTDGSFVLTAPLQRNLAFEIFDVPILLSPGDYLEVKANLDSILSTTVYQGNCAKENELWLKLRHRDDHQNEDSEKLMKILNENADPVILYQDARNDFNQDSTLIAAWKEQINPFHFWDIYWEYRYLEAWRMFIFPGSYRMPALKRLEPIKYIGRFNTLPILNDWSEYGYDYPNFLHRIYMSYKSSGIRVFNVYTSNVPHGSVDDLAKFMLTGEPLSKVLYNNLSGDYTSLYTDYAGLFAESTDFINSSPDSVLVENVKKFRNTMQSLDKGKALPDFEVYNLEGKKLKAKNLQGKKTIFSIALGPSSLHAIQYARLAKRYPYLNIVHVYPLPYREFKQKYGAQIPPPYTKDNLFFPKDLKAAQDIHDHFCFNEYGKWEAASYSRLFFVNETGKIADFIDDTKDQAQLRADFADRLHYFLAQKNPAKSNLTWLYILLGNLALGGSFLALRTRYIRRREARKRRLTEIELKSLRAQLNPHFIFNTMGSIQHLIASQQSEKANDYLADLAALMRLVLRATQKGIISLREELDLVEQYCALENLRKPFTLRLDIAPELDVNACEVPALLLQPYVENAILHGLAPVNARGEIELQLRRDGLYVIISIQDNGVGIHQARQKNSNGTQSGLKMNQERLQLMYGAEASVHIVDLVEKDPTASGTTVTLKLPCC